MADIQAVVDGIAKCSDTELFEMCGPQTEHLLRAVFTTFEQFEGANQALAHAILLGELFAQADDDTDPYATELYSVEDRIALLIAQIRRAYELSHEKRNAMLPLRGN